MLLWTVPLQRADVISGSLAASFRSTISFHSYFEIITFLPYQIHMDSFNEMHFFYSYTSVLGQLLSLILDFKVNCSNSNTVNTTCLFVCLASMQCKLKNLQGALWSFELSLITLISVVGCSAEARRVLVCS